MRAVPRGAGAITTTFACFLLPMSMLGPWHSVSEAAVLKEAEAEAERRAHALDLFALPFELLMHIVRMADQTCVSRMDQTCRGLHSHIGAILKEAKKRLEKMQLEWHVHDGTTMFITDPGRGLCSLVTLASADTSSKRSAYGQRTTVVGNGVAVARPLPTSGSASWTMQIDNSFNNCGNMKAGVCSADGAHRWQLALNFGQLVRSHKIEGRPRTLAYPDEISPPPPGYPPAQNCVLDLWGGSGIAPGGPQVLRAADASPSMLFSRAIGSVIKFTWDADVGSLSISLIKCGPYHNPRNLTMKNSWIVEELPDEPALAHVFTLGGFPKGAILRPCVSLIPDSDQVTFPSHLGISHSPGPSDFFPIDWSGDGWLCRPPALVPLSSNPWTC